MPSLRPLRQAPLAQPASQSSRRIVPFDHQVRFELTGRRDHALTQLINVSVEGYFVAVALGYSLMPAQQINFPAQISPSPPGGPPSQLVPLENVTLGNVLDGFQYALQTRGVPNEEIEAYEKELLRSGWRIHPGVINLILGQGSKSFFVDSLGDGIHQLFQSGTCEAEQVHFLYRLIDNASNREFQSEAVHNVAGLGSANGKRPFRFLPRPLVFEPRAVIRIQVTEISGRGRLFFVLQGYKILL